MTAKPYLGSLSVMVWPPATAQPACPALEAPPWNTMDISSPFMSAGKRQIKASTGSAPLA
jgi:hypothetical protein